MAYEWITDALDETWSDIDRFLRLRPFEVYEAPTACPGWTVRDVISHLLGVALVMAGEPVPRHEGAWPEYVHNPIGELNEAFVEANRSRPGLEVLDAFREASRRCLATLRALDDEGWARLGWSPEGERPFHRFQETRVLDGWIHFQDIRDALGEPSDDPGIGGEVVLNRFEAALPYIIGKRVGAPNGTLVRVNLTGPRGRSVAIAVRDRRAEAVTSSEETPTLELTTSTSLFWRRAAGRVGADDFLDGCELHGDLALARTVAESLRVML
jgi:uncharacterized protein (TIGR03083 family)